LSKQELLQIIIGINTPCVELVPFFLLFFKVGHRSFKKERFAPKRAEKERKKSERSICSMKI